MRRHSSSRVSFSPSFSPSFCPLFSSKLTDFAGAASMMSQGIDLGSHPNASSFPPSASSGETLAHTHASHSHVTGGLILRAMLRAFLSTCGQSRSIFPEISAYTGSGLFHFHRRESSSEDPTTCAWCVHRLRRVLKTCHRDQ